MSDTNDTIVYDFLDRGTAQVLEVRRCGFPVLGAPCSRVVGHEGACVPTVLRDQRRGELVDFEDFLHAASVKWHEGRELYGAAWHGKPPLVELFDECCDAWNYIHEDDRRNGESGLSRRIKTLILETAGSVRLLHRSRP